MHGLDFIPALHQDINHNRISGAVLLRRASEGSSAQRANTALACRFPRSLGQSEIRRVRLRDGCRELLNLKVGYLGPSLLPHARRGIAFVDWTEPQEWESKLFRYLCNFEQTDDSQCQHSSWKQSSGEGCSNLRPRSLLNLGRYGSIRIGVMSGRRCFIR